MISKTAGLLCLLIVCTGFGVASTINTTPVAFGQVELSAFNGTVATFTDSNVNAQPADFNAQINWGDGSPANNAVISLVSGTFQVGGVHTYADEGSFTVTVTVNDNSPGTGTATATTTGTITEGDSLSGSPLIFYFTPGMPATGAVANFTDTLAASSSDFFAIINWGDATSSAGSVSGSNGAFQVQGTHTYVGGGNRTITTTLSDDAPGTASATVQSNAFIPEPGTFLLGGFGLLALARIVRRRAA